MVASGSHRCETESIPRRIPATRKRRGPCNVPLMAEPGQPTLPRRIGVLCNPCLKAVLQTLCIYHEPSHYRYSPNYLHRSWSRWAEVLVMVNSETVVGWYHAGFQLYWRWRSRPRAGRPKITSEIRDGGQRQGTKHRGLGSASLLPYHLSFPDVKHPVVAVGKRVLEHGFSRNASQTLADACARVQQFH